MDRVADELVRVINAYMKSGKCVKYTEVWTGRRENIPQRWAGEIATLDAADPTDLYISRIPGFGVKYDFNPVCLYYIERHTERA